MLIHGRKSGAFNATASVYPQSNIAIVVTRNNEPGALEDEQFDGPTEPGEISSLLSQPPMTTEEKARADVGYPTSV